MLIIPAIDLLNGTVVRLHKGDYAAVTAYGVEPVELAIQLAKAGVRRLHLVDLDAAQAKGLDNRAVIRQIRQAVDCQIELGGGIRSQSDVDKALDLGIDYLVIGTALVQNPAMVAGWCAAAPGRFIAGIDADNGLVKTGGWLNNTAILDTTLAESVKSLGFSAIIYTNISKDGTLAGPDIDRTVAVAKAAGMPVILSGGLGSTADALALQGLESRGIVGFISGKALYEGRLDLGQLLSFYPQNKNLGQGD